MSTISQGTLDKLRTFDTPTICNLIELFDIRPRHTGYTNRTIKAAFPEMPPMVGFASTATHRSYVQRRGADAYSSLMEQVARFKELDGPAVVVFQDFDDDRAAATFGEVMCSTYRAFGSVGLVTSGPGRDMEQVRALDFPVFTNGAVASHGYNHIIDLHVPVLIGGLTVYPGDLLHGDVNGISNIPVEIASEVADIGDEFIAAEQMIIDVMRQTTFATVAQWNEANAEKTAMVEAIRKRISG